MISHDEMMGIVATEAAEAAAGSPPRTCSAALSNRQMLDVIRERVRAVDFQGNLAKQLDISPQYLCDVLGGRREVSAHLAEKLGYKRVVSFVPLNARYQQMPLCKVVDILAQNGIRMVYLPECHIDQIK